MRHIVVSFGQLRHGGYTCHFSRAILDWGLGKIPDLQHNSNTLIFLMVICWVSLAYRKGRGDYNEDEEVQFDLEGACQQRADVLYLLKNSCYSNSTLNADLCVFASASLDVKGWALG